MTPRMEISEDLLKDFDIEDESRLREIIKAGIRIEEAIHLFKEGKDSDAVRCFREMVLQALSRELKPGQGDMKFIIFAGGTGTRLWPISRKKLPKQFIPMFDGKSTLQLAFERVERVFCVSNIYVSTIQDYVSLVKEQLPDLPDNHIIDAPENRNVGPAVGCGLIHLRKEGHRGPVAILWADHLMEHVDKFIDVLKKGETLVKEKPDRLVFIGEKPRYAESNLGWIHVGNEIEKGKGIYEFKEWYYRPPPEKSKKMSASGQWYWNPGYFVVDLEFTLCLYRVYAPTMYQQLKEIEKALKTPKYEETIRRIYPRIEPFHFDQIIEEVPPNYAVVLCTYLGWSDPGTLYAFKEAKVGLGEVNYTQGLTIQKCTTDSLIINKVKGKLVATVGLDGMVVVNTPEALIVVHKDNVSKVSELVKKLEEDKELKRFV